MNDRDNETGPDDLAPWFEAMRAEPAVLPPALEAGLLDAALRHQPRSPARRPAAPPPGLRPDVPRTRRERRAGMLVATALAASVAAGVAIGTSEALLDRVLSAPGGGFEQLAFATLDELLAED